ncbi:FH2 domain-containing protein 1-like [Chroicocephalus ridibundus]|uniref:FH2 domain-containing protein 1-like n=1 Tax=Chroicocephalus ridibundus TaxID=1192867 RepID=UPI002FDE9138
MLLLIEVPSYARRLELLVLQEEFFPRLSALRAAIQTLTAAAEELLECQELHVLLHLILSAGNHLNSGGYAGSAAGFRLASLLKLPDTKANEPGMDLLHFVAMEAARMEKNLLDFPGKLRHVGPASRIDAAEVEGELRRLAGRLAGARGAEGPGPRLQPFVGAAEAELRGARDALQRMHRVANDALDYFCEDAGPGALPELCAVLHAFATRLLAAAQENRAREQAQRRRQQMERERLKRRSVATCSARDATPREATTDAPLPLTPQPGRHGLRSPRPGPPLPPAIPTAPPQAGGCPQPPPGAPAGGQGGISQPGPEPPPPATAAAPPSPQPLFSLFPRRGACAEPGTPPSPPQGSALMAFLRRLVGGAGGRAPPS